jgi:hypothetical protein
MHLLALSYGVREGAGCTFRGLSYVCGTQYPSATSGIAAAVHDPAERSPQPGVQLPSWNDVAPVHMWQSFWLSKSSSGSGMLSFTPSSTMMRLITSKRVANAATPRRDRRAAWNHTDTHAPTATTVQSSPAPNRKMAAWDHDLNGRSLNLTPYLLQSIGQVGSAMGIVSIVDAMVCAVPLEEEEEEGEEEEEEEEEGRTTTTTKRVTTTTRRRRGRRHRDRHTLCKIGRRPD